MTPPVHLALDLGAESGRAILGVLAGAKGNERLELHELRRFPTASFSSGGVLHWEMATLRQEARDCLAAAGAHCRAQGLRLASIGVDTWGVDYGLATARGTLVEPPRCYREPSHLRGFEVVKERIGLDRLYERTGIHPMAINTISQLAAQAALAPGLFEGARSLLFMPDLFHHFLSGRAVTEATIASTSGLVDVRTGRWATDLLAPLGVPDRLLGEIVQPGTRLGLLLPDLAGAAGLGPDVDVITPAAHDTASAVAAIPAGVGEGFGDGWCYLSSGTWSLMGVVLDSPILSETAHRAGFTNERGLGYGHAGKRVNIRFLKNIAGLWLVQQVRADLAGAGESIEYERLTALAADAQPFRTRLDIDDPELVLPGRMIEKLRAQSARLGDPAPETPAQLARACLEALALSYRRTLVQLEGLLGRRLETIHLVGGGGRNALLNQMTADATGQRVVVGPHEATAAGNILVQALGAGLIRPADIRRIVARSFETAEFVPRQTRAWDEAARRYSEIGEVTT